MSSDDSKKLVRFRLLAVVGSTALSLVVFGSIGLFLQRNRPIYLQEPGYELTGHRYLYDRLLGWRNILNWQASTRGQPLTINSMGLRGAERSHSKSADAKRLLILGDSFAWGYGVGDSAVFASVLERNLAAGSNTTEVLNAGVSGWGTDQEYLYFKHEGYKYDPDVVILAVFLVNDPDNNASSQQYGLFKPVFVDTALTLENVPVPKPGSDRSPIETRAPAPNLTVSIIHHLAALCRSQSRQLVVMKFGRYLYPKDEAYLNFERRFENQLTKDFSGHYLDLDTEFEALGLEKQVLTEGNDDGHWNAYGHEQTADILLHFLNKEGLLESD